MKKILFIAAAAIVALGSCTKGSIPSGSPKTDLDTLSYELGVANSQGVKMYLANQLGVDTAYMDEFYKGFAAAAQAGDDKKLAAYYAGIQIGQQIGTQVYAAANSELFGQDSTKTVNLQQLVAGFIEGTKGEPVIPLDTIKKELNKRIEAYKDQYLSKTFGDNKKKSDDFIAQKAKEEGVQKLPGGTLYKVLSEGNGPTPKQGAKVQVIYEGKTIDGNVFDSSEKNNEGKPTEILLNQVIPAWQEALTQMQQGSEWELYVPYNQAYGNRDMGQIKPYSALIFKIKLVNADSDITKSKK
ncbi:MAG: FKBP-type peptidyl-prolyl cis-trans isomerase [Bacteroidaceae bacterium]|nr:FKBP-type peptidyl-prolyl cis-trans isomerase [Bacteroidaceae bacterium]MBO4593153.1 FKBP-type peptidyl-prolyl cis-trans isomerase [Bacteroidaceae bacterium]MBR4131084.1 FKBP-type peptidyl-prolyl cis-trans isomerase [Bacteroidaceae bacterium]MBR4783200.1 FKBP-type peptidyl-prolyl cis-trans isomerase [Bacteroidaceae bacterium]